MLRRAYAVGAVALLVGLVAPALAYADGTGVGCGKAGCGAGAVDQGHLGSSPSTGSDPSTGSGDTKGVSSVLRRNFIVMG